MKVLVVYDTIEGQTRKIARRIADIATEAGHTAEVLETASADRAALEGAGAVVMCAPVHGSCYPAPFMDLVRDWAPDLDARPSAMVSVSLAITGEEPELRAEGEGYPTRLLPPAGWTPKHIYHAAGALKYSEYDFFKRWIMRTIARRQGIASDGTADQEFTDWAALEAFVRDFLAGAAR